MNHPHHEFSVQLCHHKFQFRPVYHPNAPSSLPWLEVTRILASKGWAGLSVCLRAGVVGQVWLFLVPLLTCWMWRMAFTSSLGEVNTPPPHHKHHHHHHLRRLHNTTSKTPRSHPLCDYEAPTAGGACIYARYCFTSCCIAPPPPSPSLPRQPWGICSSSHTEYSADYCD